MLSKRTWGDEIIINAISIMWQLTTTIVFASDLWQLTTTIVFASDLRHLKIRHNIPQEELVSVDLVLVYSKQSHYSATGKLGTYMWTHPAGQAGQKACNFMKYFTNFCKNRTHRIRCASGSLMSFMEFIM